MRRFELSGVSKARWRWMRAAFALAMLGCIWAASLVWQADKRLDWILVRAGQSKLSQKPDALFPANAVRVFVCGSSSPLATRTRAKTCIGVLANDELLLFDVGAGSWRNIENWGIPAQRLSHVFLTHFHSDHIADLDEANVQSWIFGRPHPLVVAGPTGVDQVVDGYNRALALDYGYRNTFGTERVLPAAVAVMQSQAIAPGIGQRIPVYRNGALTVSAFLVDHRPVEPALGYRVDYGGRSIVISGDTRWTATTREFSQGVDLLFHEAQSARLSAIMSHAAALAHDERMRFVMAKAGEYHTKAEDFSTIARETNARQIVMYHLAPPPDQLLLQRYFLAGAPSNVMLARDGLNFTLKLGEREIESGYF